MRRSHMFFGGYIMRLTPLRADVIVILVGLFLSTLVYQMFSGYGYISFGPAHFHRNGTSALLAFLVFGLWSRYCHVSIAPNTQGIQVCFGVQTGEVWSEGNFHFTPRPVWDIWKEMSVEHLLFTVAAQNRSKEGHQMVVLATGRGIPQNAYAMAKLRSPEDLLTQLVAHSMQTIGKYIHRELRETLLDYPSFDLSRWFASDPTNVMFATYGVQVDLTTTKVFEVNPQTMAQFDQLARKKDMDVIVEGLKVSFPEASDVERYAIYATMVGFKPAVMSHIIHGQAANFFVDGRSAV